MQLTGDRYARIWIPVHLNTLRTQEIFVLLANVLVIVERLPSHTYIEFSNVMKTMKEKKKRSDHEGEFKTLVRIGTTVKDTYRILPCKWNVSSMLSRSKTLDPIKCDLTVYDSTDR